MIRRHVVVAVLAALALGGVRAQPPAPTRFAVVDVYLDSATPVAAWQFELTERRAAMQVVGVEGGEGAGFREPPYYDRAAVERGAADRIVVASYSLGSSAELPSGRVRVASVHVRLSGAASPEYRLRLVAAGAADGRPIDAKISLETNAGR